jgi:hypothetical protein
LHAKSENSNSQRLASRWVEVNIGNLREDYTLFVRFCRLTSDVLPRDFGCSAANRKVFVLDWKG